MKTEITMTFRNAKGDKVFVALSDNGSHKRTGFGKTEKEAIEASQKNL